MSELERRRQLLREASTLLQNNGDSQTISSLYESACNRNWVQPTDYENAFGVSSLEGNELPILDPITQSPVRAIPDKIVVLSDGFCYDKHSIADFVDRSAPARAPDGFRHKLPMSGKYMTDGDYYAVDRQPITTEEERIEASEQISDVGAQSLEQPRQYARKTIQQPRDRQYARKTVEQPGQRRYYARKTGRKTLR